MKIVSTPIPTREELIFSSRMKYIHSLSPSSIFLPIAREIKLLDSYMEDAYQSDRDLYLNLLTRKRALCGILDVLDVRAADIMYLLDPEEVTPSE